MTNAELTMRIGLLMEHAYGLLPENERTPEKLAEIQDWVIGWLMQPLFGQQGRTPLQALRTDKGLHEMKDTISRMVYGVYS